MLPAKKKIDKAVFGSENNEILNAIDEIFRQSYQIMLWSFHWPTK